MQTKINSLFFLIVMASALMLFYATDTAKAQKPSIAVVDVSVFIPSIISITPKLGHPKNKRPLDTVLRQKPAEPVQKSNQFNGYSGDSTFLRAWYFCGFSEPIVYPK
jgi:hypothetical protein